MLKKTKSKKDIKKTMKTRNRSRSGKRKDKLRTKKYNKQPKFKKSRKAGMKPVLVGVDRSERPRRVISDTPAQRDLKETESKNAAVEKKRKTARAEAAAARVERLKAAAAEAKAEVDRVQKVRSQQFIQHAMRMKRNSKTRTSLPIRKKKYLRNLVDKTIRSIMVNIKNDSRHLTPQQREVIPGKKEYYSHYIQHQIIDDGLFAELFDEADESKKTKMLQNLKILADNLLTDAVKPGPTNFEEKISQRLIEFYTDHDNNPRHYTKEQVEEALAEVDANDILGDESNNTQMDKDTATNIQAALNEYIKEQGAGEYQVDIKT